MKNFLLKSEDLSGHTELFGWRFKEGGSYGLVELLIEDDDSWYPFVEFDVSWIKDFHQMSTLLLESHHEPL
jgi:hypothetical protein